MVLCFELITNNLQFTIKNYFSIANKDKCNFLYSKFFLYFWNEFKGIVLFSSKYISKLRLYFRVLKISNEKFLLVLSFL